MTRMLKGFQEPVVFAAISPACRLLHLMANTPKRPIGFGREKDSDPNGTGDGFQWQPNDAAPEEAAPEKPTRLPKVVPVFVGTSEGLGILAAYDLYPLTPLSNLEQQLLQVVAALEQRVTQLEPDN